jgi:hypothetical protein
MDCGPPSVAMSVGSVMKGPTPIMFDMFSAVADHGPSRFSR